MFKFYIVLQNNWNDPSEKNLFNKIYFKNS